MFKHILKKTLIAIATIWLIITISFTLVHTMPGDPIIFLIGEEEYYYLLDNNPAYLEQVTEKFGPDHRRGSGIHFRAGSCVRFRQGCGDYHLHRGERKERSRCRDRQRL